MDRRRTLLAVTAAVASVAVAGRGHHSVPAGRADHSDASSAGDRDGGSTPVFTAHGVVTVPVPRSTLAVPPGNGHEIAVTVDDGVDSAVVGAYALAVRTAGC
jgi:hypothetical protein